jgi:hypothetical protein
MKPRRYILASLIVAGVLIGFLLLKDYRGERRIARVMAPDGTELYIVQNPEGRVLFWVTECFYRKAGGQWGLVSRNRFDLYWRKPKVEIDIKAKRITVYRKGQVNMTFDWETERFQEYQGSTPLPASTGTSRLMPVGWDFPDLK